MPKSNSPGNEQPESHPGERQPAFSFPDAERPGAAFRIEPSANRFYAIAREPRSLFVYWELGPGTAVPGAALSLAIHRADGGHETTCRLEEPGGIRVIGVSLPGTPYTLTLGYLADGGLTREDMTVLAEQSVETPRDRPVGSGGPPADALARLFPVTRDAASSSMH